MVVTLGGGELVSWWGTLWSRVAGSGPRTGIYRCGFHPAEPAGVPRRVAADRHRLAEAGAARWTGAQLHHLVDRGYRCLLPVPGSRADHKAGRRVGAGGYLGRAERGRQVGSRCGVGAHHQADVVTPTRRGCEVESDGGAPAGAISGQDGLLDRAGGVLRRRRTPIVPARPEPTNILLMTNISLTNISVLQQ